jgi:exosome complex component RRP42
MMLKQAKQHISALLSKDGRLDGRKLDEYRKPVSVEYGISKSAEGSARVQIGDTIVLAGVKMEIGTPYPDTPDEGALMVGVEMLPIASPDFESGPPSIDAIELSRVVDRGIREGKAVDMKKLCIEEGETNWVISIDIVTLNASGNLFDACALAALAAIKDARLPAREGKVIDYKNLTDEKLPVLKYPVSVTVYKIGDKLIVDPTHEEEAVLDARLTVSLLDNGELCAMQKGGEGTFSADEINAIVKLAATKSKELRKVLDA